MNKFYNLTFTICILAISQVAIGQYCTAIGPSSDIDSNVESVTISGESGSQINYTGCPGVIGLEDQTAQSVTLDGGSTYSLSVQFGTCGGNYGSAGEAWIDYNGDQTFDASESIGTWSGTPPSAVQVFNFTVPATIIAGTTRLRVMQHEGGALPLQPCATFTWGSVVDFSVNLTGGIDCSGYVGDDMSDPRIVSSIPYQESYANTVCYTNANTVYNSPDVFYRVNLNEFSYDLINVSLCGSTFDTYLSVLDLDTNVLFTNDDYSGCGTQSELTFPTNGLDTVFVVVQGWGSEQGDYEIAINDGETSTLTENELQISVFPNPTINDININGIKEITNYTLIDYQGKIVATGTLNQDTRLDINHLNSGIYILQLVSDNTSKIVKLKKL
ncbi:MAG: T9SS type A sorting domain-containing protein [Crocinitomicaceae bacterium]